MMGFWCIFCLNMTSVLHVFLLKVSSGVCDIINFYGVLLCNECII